MRGPGRPSRVTTRRAALSNPNKKDAYHHANLRRALLDAALVHLRAGDVTSLNLQVLARAAGVSRGAPYHHFPDKVALLAAIAEEGFELWLAKAVAVVALSLPAAEALLALAKAWLDFASRHPEHYRVMFLRDVEDRVRFASLHATSGRGLELLLSTLAALDPKATQSELLTRAVGVWSAIHGFASLRDAGVLSNIPGLPPLAKLEADLVSSLRSTAQGITARDATTAASRRRAR
jgi:AcrR family transcriptional regulator